MKISELLENASSGSTGAGSIATAVGGLGAGFDANGEWRSIYIKRPGLSEEQTKSFKVVFELDGVQNVLIQNVQTSKEARAETKKWVKQTYPWTPKLKFIAVYEI